MRARYEEYSSPFSARYTSPECQRLFSAHFKISTFRKLWVSLAKAEQKLGLSITHQQIAQLEDNVEKIDFDAALAYEKKFKHDVMAHIHAFGDQCPEAKPIIHLGATSTFVTDNTDLIQLKLGLELLLSKMVEVVRLMSKLAASEAATPCLGYTHFQPAQPVTIGKRICLWLQDFLMDAEEFERLAKSLPFLGAKGATGTQSSFLALFEGDEKKVHELEKKIASDFGFTKILSIAGQTYTRKLDLNILNALASFAASSHKMATDIRLLAHEGEMFEGFGEEQIGSSAMPYKRNPIYSERICGLARFVMSLPQNPAFTAATQWLERSLDDSSNRRFSIPEAFLGADAILNLLIHLLTHLEIDRVRAKENLEAQIHHLAMENLLMMAVKKGEDRQVVHEKLRKLSTQKNVNLTKELGLDANEVASCVDPSKLIGLAPDQTRHFLKEEVAPFLKRHQNQKQVSSTRIEV
ncbi:MAG: adenylosuccinate lyase [Parachlamydiales bacterium]|nr:adenylosuccinate lyase [Parachlamydiales bacterium]